MFSDSFPEIRNNINSNLKIEKTMKTKIIALVAIAMLATSLTAAIAQTKEKELTPAQKRKMEQKALDEQYEVRLRAALEAKTFYFRGQDMQTKSLNKYSLRPPYNYVDVQDDQLTLQLPYFTSARTMNNTPVIIDFTSDNFTYSVTPKKGTYTVVIEVKEVKNTYTATRKSQSGSYRLVFIISNSRDGFCSLSLTPNFTSTISYSGYVELDGAAE